jgi:hypothetical protein
LTSDRLPWSDLENDAIVADYMAMLSADLSGQPYSKAEHNRALQQLIGRGRGSIEYKHQNISAVLKGIGETELAGYKTAFNYQASLEDAVDRWLAERPGWYAHSPRKPVPAGAHETGALWIGTAPTLKNAPPPDEADQMARIARRFDAAGRDDRNRKLGRAGEERVVDHERSSLSAAGRADLACKIRWVSQEDGDGLGYDILSFEPSGAERLIEVKTTNGWERTPFHISRNEIAVAEERKNDWHLIRLWDFARSPKAFAIRPPLGRHVALTPTSFMASFQ